MNDPKDRRQDLGRVNRRQFLLAGASAAAAAGVLNSLSLSQALAADTTDNYQFGPLTLDGPESPFPLPWLDKNGSHNQSPGPNAEPSSIYHFRGYIARCNDFRGMGTDNDGNRIAFGAPSTDFSLLTGEYWAGRTARGGAFSHI